MLPAVAIVHSDHSGSIELRQEFFDILFELSSRGIVEDHLQLIDDHGERQAGRFGRKHAPDQASDPDQTVEFALFDAQNGRAIFVRGETGIRRDAES